MCEIQFVQLIMPRRGEGCARRHGNTQRRMRDYTASRFRELFGLFFFFFFFFQRGNRVNGRRLGVRPLPSPQTRVRTSINHLLIIAALPAHNEKVKPADIAPEVVYESTIGASETMPNAGPGRRN